MKQETPLQKLIAELTDLSNDPSLKMSAFGLRMAIKQAEKELPYEREVIENARQDGHDSTYISCDSGCGGQYYLDDSNKQYFENTFKTE